MFPIDFLRQAALAYPEAPAAADRDSRCTFRELVARSDATHDELIAFCKERVGSVKAPKKLRSVEALPRSPVGKVLRRDVRAAALADGEVK